jgi:hypothetical protein
MRSTYAAQNVTAGAVEAFYNEANTGFAGAGLGQQALMATQELKKFEDMDVKSQSAKLDLYSKNPDLLQTDIAKFRDQGNDAKANELAGYLGKITAKQDLDRAKEVADIALRNAQTATQKAQAGRLAQEIESGKFDWKVINDITGAPTHMAKINKKTGETTYEPITLPGGAPAPAKPGTTPKGERRPLDSFGVTQPAAGVSAQPSITDRVMSSAQQMLNLPGAVASAAVPANFTRENRDAAILRINPNINLNAISEADKQLIAQQLGL